jgi:predicted DNA-binding transcriptional regulator YafY
VDYVKARPIHTSQQEIETSDGWSIFSYWLKPSYNFYQNLLWHREKLEVLEPESVRGEMKEIINEMIIKY